MIGAVIGDIVGSRFEFLNYRAKDFRLFERECFPTDDSIMTIAVGKALVECDGSYSDLAAKTVESMQELGRPYPHCGYGGSFITGCTATIPSRTTASATARRCA